MLQPHTIDHKRRSTSRGSFGGEVAAADVTIATGVRCFVQGVNAFVDPRWQREDYIVTHVVYFDVNPSLQERDILVFGSLTIEVRAVHDECNLERVYRADCEEIVGKSF